MESFMENDTMDNDPSNKGSAGSLILGDFFEQARFAFGLETTGIEPPDTSAQ